MGGIVMGITVRCLALLLLATAACVPVGDRSGPIEVVDDARDTVRLAHPAQRIVSIIPASTELLFAIGAGPQLVGRSNWDDYPAEAAAVTTVGDGIGPNLEAILARRPDLVVIYLTGTNAEAVARLRALGIAVVQLRTDLLESVVDHARILGELTGHRATADSLVDAFRTALDAATISSPPGGRDPARRSVLILTWDQPPITVGAGSFMDELVTRAGGTNIFHDLPQSSAPVSLEAVAARDPDLILTSSETGPAFARRPEWQVVRAVREKKFVKVKGSEFDRPGPRSPAAIRALTAALLAAEGR
jgi:ABC-type Fe3+-hydroxamate transport system substrate-binding protein